MGSQKLTVKNYWMENISEVTIGYYHPYNDCSDIILQLVAQKFQNDLTKNPIKPLKSHSDFINLDIKQRYIIIGYVPYLSLGRKEGEALITTDNGIIPYLLTNPNVYFLFINDFKYLHDEFKPSESGSHFQSKLKSILGNYSGYESFFGFSFLPIDQVDKVDTTYISIINLLSKSSIFDPTGIRNFLQHVVYGKQHPDGNEIFQARTSILVDDDANFVEEFAYYFYRLGVSSLLVANGPDSKTLDRILALPNLQNYSIFSDQNIKFDEQKKGTEWFGSHKDKTVIVTGLKDSLEGFNSIEKPIAGVTDYLTKIKKVNYDSIHDKNEYVRFSTRQTHQVITSRLIEMVREFNSRTISNDFYYYAQVSNWDIFHLSLGRVSTQACLAYERLIKNDIDDAISNYPYNTIDIDYYVREIESNLFLSFEKSPQPDPQGDQSKPTSFRGKLIRRLKIIADQLDKSITECFVSFEENPRSDKKLKYMKIDRPEPLAYKDRIYQYMLKKITDQIGYDKEFHILKKAQYKCRQNIQQLNIVLEHKRFRKYWLLLKNEISAPIKWLLTFAGLAHIFMFWIFAFVFFTGMYSVFGEPVNAIFQNSWVKKITLGLINSFISSFAVSPKGDFFDMVIFGDKIWFSLLGSIHSCLSFICFGFIINKLIERIKK
jgi:hypothetical protein